MTIIKSFFSKSRGHGVFASALRRQVSFAVISLIILFIIILVPYMVAAPDHTQSYDYNQALIDGGSLHNIARDFYAEAFQTGIYFGDVQPGLIGSFLAVLSFAAALFSARYMHSKKMTDLFHALPVRREKLLLANMAASMLSVIGPFVLLYAGTMIGQLAVYGRYGWVGPQYFNYIAMDFLTILVYSWVVYALTYFIAVNVGTTFDALAITVAIGTMPSIVYGICGLISQVTLYGSVFEGAQILRISPILFFYERFFLFSHSTREGYYPAIASVFGVWAVIGCLIFAAAIFCYRRRKSELAGQTQPQGVFQMIIKFLASFCGSAIFLGIFYNRSLPARFIAIILPAVGIGLLAELILSRGVRHIGKNIKWLAAAGVVYILLYTGVYMDVFGFVTRIPDASSVLSASINYRGRFENVHSSRYFYMESDLINSYSPYEVTLTQPDSIDIVLNAHALAVDEYEKTKDNNEYRAGYLAVQYKLKNGATLTRNYHGIGVDACTALTGLENKGEFITQNHPVFFMEEYSARSGIPLKVAAAVSSPVVMGTTPLTLNQQELDTLLAAVKSDTLNKPLEEILTPSNPVKGYLTLSYYADKNSENYADIQMPPPARYETSGGKITECRIAFTDNDIDTMAALSKIGALPLPEQNLSNVSQVKVAGLLELGSYEKWRVIPAMTHNPWDVRNYDFNISSYQSEISSSDDPADIEWMAGRGIHQLMLDDDACRKFVYAYFFDKTGEAMAGHFVRVSDLPAGLRTQVNRYLEGQKPAL